MVLGGVCIEHDRGLAGHSDADAVLHAVTDAVLGAIGEGDIGEHFPDSDPKWRGAASAQFLRHALGLAAGRGLRVVNCDVTIIAQSPKLGPHKARIRDSIAAILGVAHTDVAVKAKTNEGMGWIGRGEGLAAMAVVLVERQ